MHLIDVGTDCHWLIESVQRHQNEWNRIAGLDSRAMTYVLDKFASSSGRFLNFREGRTSTYILITEPLLSNILNFLPQSLGLSTLRKKRKKNLKMSGLKDFHFSTLWVDLSKITESLEKGYFSQSSFIYLKKCLVSSNKSSIHIYPPPP